MSVQGFIRGLKPMIARDVKMTSTELVSYVEILDKALDTEYMKSCIWKDNAARRDANKSKVFQESNKRRPNRVKIVALEKGECQADTNKCFKCNQAGHLRKDCPQWKAGQNSNNNLVPTRVFALTHNEAANSNIIVTGQLPISGMMCKVLIDFGAAHSYVSMNMIDKLGMPCKLSEYSFSTMLLSVDMMLSTRWLLSAPITIEGRECPTDLIELNIPDYDAILGMDWLSKHGATIYCRKKIVDFRPKEGELFSFKRELACFRTPIISTLEARNMMQHGCSIFLASVVDKSKETE
ncbi:uncharacterized protein LOC133832501 [Humulus lupulus]|uniref:uncharacterized protein LOC133832501 n=1 Tax=Humulus lupulus TaxID=3486 RepID=UPI002B40ED6C|nr:uncharacterized protein LOC133832501 [Humulus lupulus]